MGLKISKFPRRTALRSQLTFSKIQTIYVLANELPLTVPNSRFEESFSERFHIDPLSTLDFRYRFHPVFDPSFHIVHILDNAILKLQ